MTAANQTQHRIKSLQTLVAEFGRREMTMVDVGELLDISISGARKYTYDLIAAKIIVQANPQNPGFTKVMKVFGIAADPALIEQFLAELALGNLPSRQPWAPPPVVVRQARAAFRHPMDIAFFGEARGAHA
ncbi:hypothetical protein [Duganella sp. BJB475]|uniref:hypothetical protein n=1 Tax=Duganella sp. BJB475 TaxID=2233914 RepID=UPI000E34DA15|nr:hypothetical protein [Duganella sp. BJB475]RFP19158.1 hypothetical protein D0T23_05090 [Duganella sp. BJB475]